MSDLIDSACIVIRSIGERTVGAAVKRLEAQVPADQIHVISEVPFSRAVRRTFEVGLLSGCRWTIGMDADVLPHEGAIGQLVAEASKTAETVFELEGRLVDKLFGGPRWVGMHLYRTSLLSRALSLCESSTPVHRPETHVIEQMVAAGFGQERRDCVLGLHDFEQSYRDLYRKGFVHAQKHAEKLRFLEPMWRRLATVDADFRAVLLGMEAGRIAGGIATTDARAFGDDVDRILAAEGLTEKSPLPAAAGEHDVGQWISGHAPTPEFLAWNHFRVHGEMPQPPAGRLKRAARRLVSTMEAMRRHCAGRVFGHS